MTGSWMQTLDPSEQDLVKDRCYSQRRISERRVLRRIAGSLNTGCLDAGL